MNLIDTMRLQWQRKQRQWRLETIKSEIEQCQQDCAALGAHIGWLIQRKTELETQINREQS